ncbi:MAG: hypothetical protein RLZZ420_1136 [Bacteroidota bacterium]|jgi:hypothetical protein
MSIKAIKGNIMDTAPLNSEAIAVWMCDGFVGRNGIWRFEIEERNIKLELIHPTNLTRSEVISASENKPWILAFDTLWKISNENHGHLKYIYIFPNPEDKQRLDSLDEMDLLINRCFDLLHEHHINSVSLILIPALELIQPVQPGQNAQYLADLASAKHMISSIKNWLSENKVDMNVYLVDQSDDFRKLMIELNQKTST